MDSSIFVTLSGMTISASAVHPANADAPITSILLGIVIFFRFVLFRNALL